ncbi:hypothetical protein [Citrobacter freundii]|uniref:hypothetical protein n=1 Tax=Citrobacter freundii TaxID=546 RepID=UPI000E1CF852|nr:hypothetical protein [Citrobacter freundii]RDU16025.1 hypothetical protein DWV02_20530 [Citrobacter freundii]
MMKISKFGTIKSNENGGIDVTGFTFCPENPSELLLDLNDINVVIPIIADFFLDRIKSSPPKNDFNVDRIVSQAIMKARCGNNG